MRKKSLKQFKLKTTIILPVLALLITATYFAYRYVAKPAQINVISSTSATLPDSSISTPFEPAGSFKVLTENSAPSDWGPISSGEAHVFWRSLVHRQEGKNWELKVGKGGQIFSIKTPETGELIPRQRVQYGEWIDEVFQHTIPSTHTKSVDNSIVDGDIHQAGYYTKSDLNPDDKIIPKSVYSPTFNSVYGSFRRDERSFSYITWPQHAHLPRTYKENGMLMHQNIRDLGDGVIEITLIIDKWAGEATNSISLPWTVFRTESVPVQILSKANGQNQTLDQSFGSSPVRLREKDSGGWIAFTKGDKSSDWGIGLVFGKEPSTIEGPISYLRFGKYNEGSPNGGTVATVKRDITLMPGDSYFFRYYLVIGPLRDIQKYGKILESKVQAGRLIAAESDNSGFIELCAKEDVGLGRGCKNGQTPLAYTYRHHVNNSLPLFLLKDSRNGKHLFSTDPYFLSNDPTDGRTEYVEFMGWVIDETKVDSSPTSCYNYVKLQDLGIHQNQEPIRNALFRLDNTSRCQ